MEKYPKLINDLPNGEDLFKGGSQKKVADLILSVMDSNQGYTKHVIGLEGERGAGKSNVIKRVEKEGEGRYHVFTFDTWGHQEDLTRRSFLEELTDNLIASNLLDKGWTDKLQEKLATNKITNTKDKPEVKKPAALLLAGLIFTPILKFLLTAVTKAFPYWFKEATIKGCFWLSNPDFILAIVLASGWTILGYFIYKAYQDEDEPFSFPSLFLLYKGKELVTRKEETITSLEPAVRKFRETINDITSKLNKNRTLVFVFDNMDRIPDDKVKEVWASIHTFFSESGLDRESWVIVPYDYQQICKVFEGDGTKPKEFADNIIQKTFLANYRVSPPIMTDWKLFFEKKYLEAFGSKPPTGEFLDNIFDYLHDDTSIKPREIITYINDLVVLKQQWKDEIPFRYLGLYALVKHELEINTPKVLTDKIYRAKANVIFGNDEQVDQYMAALHYNVPVKMADEVLLRRTIELGLRGQEDLEPYHDHSAFISVLHTSFFDYTTLHLEKASKVLSNLPENFHEKNQIIEIWERLGNMLRHEKMQFPDALDTFGNIVHHLPNRNSQIELTKEVLRQGQKFKGGGFDYRGQGYSNFLNRLEGAIGKTDLKIDEILLPIEFSAEEFIEFVEAKREQYKYYQVSCPENKVNELLVNNVPGQIGKYVDFLRYTSEEFNYKPLNESLEEFLHEASYTHQGYKEDLQSVFSAYKALNKEKPLNKVTPGAKARQIFNQDINQPAAVDLVLCILADKVETNSLHIDSNFQSFMNNEDNLKEIAENAEYYLSYGEILILAKDYPNLKLLKQLAEELTTKSYGVSRLNIETILNSYDEIRESVFSSSATKFIKSLDRWKKYYKDGIGEFRFGEEISIQFFKDCLNNNKLEISKLTIEKANQYVKDASEDEWSKAFRESDENILFKVLQLLLKSNKLNENKLSEYAHEAYKEVIVELTKKQDLPEDYEAWDRLLDCLDGRKLQRTYKDIRDYFLIEASHEITKKEAFAIEKGLFKYGKMEEKAEVFVRRMVFPWLKGDELLESILLKDKERVKQISDLILELSKLGEEYEEYIQDIRKALAKAPSELNISEDSKNEWELLIDLVGVTKSRKKDKVEE